MCDEIKLSINHLIDEEGVWYETDMQINGVDYVNTYACNNKSSITVFAVNLVRNALWGWDVVEKYSYNRYIVIGCGKNKSKRSKKTKIRRRSYADMSRKEVIKFHTVLNNGVNLLACSCGNAGCAGIDRPIQIKYRKKTIEWRVVDSKTVTILGGNSFFSFDREQYFTELKNLVRMWVRLRLMKPTGYVNSLFSIGFVPEMKNGSVFRDVLLDELYNVYKWKGVIK